jgi:hypothetical protein
MKRYLLYVILCLAAVGVLSDLARAQKSVLEELRVEEAGLVTYNIVETARGEIPVTVAYFRAAGTNPEMFWSRLETSPGVYNFRPFLDALEEGRRKGVKVGIRVITANPHGRVFPGWIRAKTVTRNGQTATAPDWEDASVQQSLRNLLVALGQQVRNHPAFLFADIGVIGWAGEFTTEWNQFRNTDFMPSIETQKRYIDYHAQAFGADRLVTNLGMDMEVLAYSMSVGVNGWRQDGFGSKIKFMTEYPPAFRDVPALWDVTGPRFFEIWGGNMTEWPNSIVSWPIDQIFDECLKYRCTMFANMGAAIPARYADAYRRFHRAMMEYAR